MWDSPADLVCKFDALSVITPPCLIEGKADKVVWRNNMGRLLLLLFGMILEVVVIWFLGLGVLGLAGFNGYLDGLKKGRLGNDFIDSMMHKGCYRYGFFIILVMANDLDGICVKMDLGLLLDIAIHMEY
ncbi:hypothetical protein Tco_0329341, partial [Tanacetum coccineum]